MKTLGWRELLRGTRLDFPVKSAEQFLNSYGASCVASHTGEAIYLVMADLATGTTTADAFDEEGRWLQRWILAGFAEVEELRASISGESQSQRFGLTQATPILRSLWREDDSLSACGSTSQPDLSELIEVAFSHESFLKSGGLFGARADFSLKIRPDHMFILPPESWARSPEVGLDFRGVDFSGATLAGCDLRNCRVEGANFEGCNLRRANLFGLDLSGCSFRAADLAYADLRETSGLILDESRILHCRYSPAGFWLKRRANWIADRTRTVLRRILRRPQMASYRDSWIPHQDYWSALRRHYTGPMLLFHLALLTVYLAPLALRAIFWKEVNQVQSLVEAAQSRADLRPFSPCLFAECDGPMPIGLAVLGFQSGLESVLFRSMLLIYNLLRGILTYRVSRLRDEEERSHYSPSKRAFAKLYSLHRVATWILIPVIAHLLLEAFNLLARTMVQIPRFR